MHRLAAGVYADTAFKTVNVGAIVSPDGIVCVDTPPNAADCRKWRLKLAQFGGQRIRYVINTDDHRDRVQGNRWLEAPVIAHEATAERLRGRPDTYRPEAGEMISPAAVVGDPPGPEISGLQLTFSKSLMLVNGKHEIHLLHRPGSALGAAWVHLPAENVLFVGDAVVVNSAPFLAEADIDLWLDNLAEIRRARFPADVIVPGRGPLTDKEGVKVMMGFLQTARRKIHRLAARRGPADSASIVPDLLDYFPISDSEREQAARRLKPDVDRLIEQARGEAAR